MSIFMSFLNDHRNGPVKLSVIIASLLAASCSSTDMNIFDSQTEQPSEERPLSLVDGNEEMDSLSKDDPKFLLSEAANIAIKENKPQEAFQYWEQLIEKSPDYRPAYLGYSSVGRKIGEYNRVLAKLYDFKNRYPDDLMVTSEIAKTHYGLKNYTQALKEVDKAVALQDTDWKMYSLRGVISDKLNYYSEAKASYNKALELSPDNPVVLNNLAVSMMMNGKYAEAELYAVKAIDNKNTDKNVNNQAYRTYAKILALKGDGDKAEALLAEKMDDEDGAKDIVDSVNNEVSKPILWGRR
jgi:Flp pilus assembly protein TadD